MNLVLDASAGIELALGRAGAADLRVMVESAERVYSSELYRIETANTLWKYRRAGLVDRSLAFRLLECCLALVDEFLPLAAQEAEALADAIRFDHPTYDLLYLAIARRTGSCLATLDRKLRDIARREGLELAP